MITNDCVRKYDGIMKKGSYMEKCEKCEFAKKVYANGCWNLLCCTHEPFIAWCIDKIDKCPKSDK